MRVPAELLRYLELFAGQFEFSDHAASQFGAALASQLILNLRGPLSVQQTSPDHGVDDASAFGDASGQLRVCEANCRPCP